jgi:hypothetical protein
LYPLYGKTIDLKRITLRYLKLGVKIIKVLPDKYKIPDSHRRKVLSGYFSIILFFLGLDLIPLFNVYLNVNWEVILAIFTLIPGGILGVYFLRGFFKTLSDLSKNPYLTGNKSTLRTLYLLIWGLSLIWIFLNQFIYNLNLYSFLQQIFPVIIFMLLTIIVKNVIY